MSVLMRLLRRGMIRLTLGEARERLNRLIVYNTFHPQLNFIDPATLTAINAVIAWIGTQLALRGPG